MAKQPTFQLESLLTLKTRMVETEEMELAALLAAEQQAQSRLQAIEKARRDRQDALRQQARGHINCGDLSGYWAALGQLDQAVQQQTRMVAEASQRVSAKRAELTRLMQEKKALEKLKEKAAREWQLNAARAEARFMDDLSIAKFARRQAAERSAQESGK